MKTCLKFLLKHYLRLITLMVLFVHRPTVVAIAGSVNKNFVKQEIKSRLERMGLDVRANPKNFNTEIGLPLAILDLPSGYNEYRKWIPVILGAPLKIFQRNFPKFLILSLGTSDEGDMGYLLSMLKPDISIVTDITQRYREGFSDMNNLVEEYHTLTNKTRKKGTLVLNSDNYRVREIAKDNKRKIIYFGFSELTDAMIKEVIKTPKGQKVIIKYKDKEREQEIQRFGKHHAYAFTIGFIVETELIKMLATKKTNT